MTTAEELRNILKRILDERPATGDFLELSRDRETAYVFRGMQRWLEIVHIIEQKGEIQRCLDVGTTPFTFALKRWCKDVDTLDLNTLLESRCNAAGIKLFVGGRHWQDNLLPDNHYDCICFLEVIEHMHANPEKVISYLKNKLRPGGILILSTPNLMCFGNRVKMLFNRKLAHFNYPPFERDEEHPHTFGHDRLYAPAEMREYFEHTGWSSFRLGYHGMAVSDSLSVYPFWIKVLRLPIQLIKYLIPSTRQVMLVVAQK